MTKMNMEMTKMNKTVNNTIAMKKETEMKMNITCTKKSVIVNGIEIPTGMYQLQYTYLHSSKGTVYEPIETWVSVNPKRFPNKALCKLVQLALNEDVSERCISITYGFKSHVNAEGVPYTPYCVGHYDVLNDQGKWYLDKEMPEMEEAFHKIMVTSEKGDTQIIVRHKMSESYYIMREYDYVPYVVRQVMAEDFPSVWKRLRKAGYVQQSCSWSDAMVQGAIVDYHNGVNRRKDVNEQLRIQLPGLFR